ncbi:MAG: hypothetical protein IKI56_01580 [Ruminococcus sp.]|nr:hypothetical protein [Ruminococcus sp.]
MKKLIALITTAILAVSMVTSCGKSNSSSQTGHKWENSETLNEWQKSLLEAQGLPTDIEKLTSSQKRSIQHIYEMITYLNEKYDEEFVYAGYVEPGLMDEETLYARSLSDKKKRTVTVKIDSDGDFTDDYMGSSVADYCENLIGDYVRSYFDSKDVAYFMSENANRLNSMKEVENGDFNWDIGVQNVFFLSNNDVCLEEIESFSHEFAKWLFKHSIVSENQFNIVRNTDMRNISYSNYATYYHEKYFVSRFSLHINPKGVSTCLAAELSNQIIKDYSIDEYIN